MIRSLDEFKEFDNEKLADMWNILILDEPSDSQDILSKVNVANLIDMLYEDWESKNSVQAVQI